MSAALWPSSSSPAVELKPVSGHTAIIGPDFANYAGDPPMQENPAMQENQITQHRYLDSSRNLA